MRKMFRVRSREKRLRGFSFVDLFSGIGGFHLALRSYGAKCVFASEINKAAAKVYSNNFKIQPKGDIREIKVEEIPKHDILCAGFPCQPFSISGNQKGFRDENGRLYFEILRIAKHHKPKLILLENVKNLLTHNNGKTIEFIEKSLQKLGYKTYKEVICATNFSVPQARKRIYIVAFRDDLEVKEFEFPKGKGKLKSISDILEDDVDAHYEINVPYTINIAQYDNIKKTNLLLRIGSVGQGRQGERIYSIKGQGITLSSQGGGVGGRTGMYYINNTVRKLTPRECARMMGFPETFKVAETDAECYRQFGNSVVVNVLQEIVGEASKYITRGGTK